MVTLTSHCDRYSVRLLFVLCPVTLTGDPSRRSIFEVSIPILTTMRYLMWPDLDNIKSMVVGPQGASWLFGRNVTQGHVPRIFA